MRFEERLDISLDILMLRRMPVYRASHPGELGSSWSSTDDRGWGAYYSRLGSSFDKVSVFLQVCGIDSSGIDAERPDGLPYSEVKGGDELYLHACCLQAAYKL
jgi:hypothetical protein